MEYIISNDILTVKISDHGGELISAVNNADGCEYVWQGDAAYWNGQCPIMFPICGRLVNETYTYEGKEYKMGTHGFTRLSTFALKEKTDSKVTLNLSANEETKKIYPFDFSFDVTYELSGRDLSVEMVIKNTGKKILPATCGGHPGFNVPLTEGNKFEDYYLEFSEECSPDEFNFNENGFFLVGGKTAVDLEDGRIIRLTRSFFDKPAHFSCGHAKQVTLKSDKDDRSVTLSFPEFPYLGIWQAHTPTTPYLCIEPWCGLPDYAGAIGDISKKTDMFRILPSSEKKKKYTISFN